MKILNAKVEKGFCFDRLEGHSDGNLHSTKLFIYFICYSISDIWFDISYPAQFMSNLTWSFTYMCINVFSVAHFLTLSCILSNSYLIHDILKSFS